MPVRSREAADADVSAASRAVRCAPPELASSPPDDPCVDAEVAPRPPPGPRRRSHVTQRRQQRRH